MIPEAEQELPQPIQPVGVLDPTLLPKGSVALTRNGRSYTRAAAALMEYQKRRKALLDEYQQLYKTKINPLVEDIIRTHAIIDEIIKEMSQS